MHVTAVSVSLYHIIAQKSKAPVPGSRIHPTAAS